MNEFYCLNNQQTVANSINESETLTQDQKEALLYMYQEEKLAHDVYAKFADEYGLRIFENISKAEERHKDAIESLLEKYNVDDSSVVNLKEGEFLNDDLQKLYNDLIEKGSSSLKDALEVGVMIEEHDINDLNSYIKDDQNITSAMEVVFSHLDNGSHHHLSAFEHVLDFLHL